MDKIKVLKRKSLEEKGNLDFGMLVTIIILLCFGLVMVSSASSYHALTVYENSNYLFTRQLIFAILGVVFMLIISKMNYRVFAKWSMPFYIVSLVLLILVLTPLGVNVNGATRWLGFGSFRFQPSEIMKIALVLVTAAYIAKNHKKMNNIKGYIVPIVLLGTVMLVMFLQKHMSGTLVMIVASASIIFASGIKIKGKYIIALILIGVLAVSAFVIAEPFRVKRILSFANPEEDIKDGNWQAAQSLYAIGSGGLFGRGLRAE